MIIRCTSWQAASAEKIPMLLRLGLFAVLLLASMSLPTRAADLEGAWAINASSCSKVFVKKDNKVSFTEDADLYGGGFIVEGTRASRTFQKCKIKTNSQAGNPRPPVAACAGCV